MHCCTVHRPDATLMVGKHRSAAAAHRKIGRRASHNTPHRNAQTAITETVTVSQADNRQQMLPRWRHRARACDHVVTRTSTQHPNTRAPQRLRKHDNHDHRGAVASRGAETTERAAPHDPPHMDSRSEYYSQHRQLATTASRIHTNSYTSINKYPQRSDAGDAAPLTCRRTS